MKHFSMCLMLTVFFGCSGKKKVCTENVSLNDSILSRRLATDKGVIVSCYRCTCIDRFMDQFVKKGIDIPVYGDTSCLKQRPLNFYLISQKLIDTLYQRNYNAILFK